MRLSTYTDFALRVLIHLAAHPEKLCSISEISRAYGVSQNHLMKVVHDLGKAGYVTSVRGRLGGIKLARAPKEINVGEVVRHTEGGFELVDCGNCVIAPACKLTGVLQDALDAFMDVLDGYTIADILTKRRDALRAILGGASAA